MTKFVGENEKFSATGSRCRHNLVWQTVMYLARSTVVDSSFNNLVRYMNCFVVNDLWRCPSGFLCCRRFLNCQLLTADELRDCLHLNNISMPYSGSLLLDQPLLKLLFPKQEYIPSNSLRPGTWRVVVTLKIPLSCNVSTSVWLKVFRLLYFLYQVICGRGRPSKKHCTPWFQWFSKR